MYTFEKCLISIDRCVRSYVVIYTCIIVVWLSCLRWRNVTPSVDFALPSQTRAPYAVARWQSVFAHYEVIGPAIDCRARVWRRKNSVSIHCVKTFVPFWWRPGNRFGNLIWNLLLNFNDSYEKTKVSTFIKDRVAFSNQNGTEAIRSICFPRCRLFNERLQK